MGYMDNFSSTRMPRDLHGFAEKAIEIAGQTGERKRQFKTQTASNLARARMAELERQESGATKRQTMLEAGKEARHLREYGRPGIGDPGGFRYVGLAKTEAGKEARHLREHGPEGTATQRLSWVKEQATKEQAAKDFTIRAGGVMGEFVKRDSAGNEVLDPKLAAAWARAKSLGIDDPAEGLVYLKKAVKFLREQGKVADEGAGEDVGKQAPRLSGKTIEEQLPTLSMEDISLAEASGFIAPEKAQKLKKEKLLQQRLAAFMPKEAIVPQTRGTDYYDLSYGRSQRLGEMR